MANTMGASYSAFFIRLRELGLLKRHDLSEFIPAIWDLDRTVIFNEQVRAYHQKTEVSPADRQN
jgi:hypothetical protein